MNVNCISTVRNALDPHLSIEADDIVYVSLKNRLVSLFDRPDDVPTHRVSFAKFAEEILYPSRVRDEGEEEGENALDGVDLSGNVSIDFYATVRTADGREYKVPLSTANLSDGVLTSLLDGSGFTLTTNGQ